MSSATLRCLSERDIPSVLNIYAPYVTDTTITFEYKVPTLEEFTRRVRDITQFYPFLVAEKDHKLVGYAYAFRHMDRLAYQWNAELSIYLKASETDQGIGSSLYRALFVLLERMGIRNLYAIVTHPNPLSEMFHLSHGFAPAGTWHQTGCKFGRWLDVGLLEKSLGDHSPYPDPPIPFANLNPGWVGQVLAEAEEGFR